MFEKRVRLTLDDVGIWDGVLIKAEAEKARLIPLPAGKAPAFKAQNTELILKVFQAAVTYAPHEESWKFLIGGVTATLRVVPLAPLAQPDYSELKNSVVEHVAGITLDPKFCIEDSKRRIFEEALAAVFGKRFTL